MAISGFERSLTDLQPKKPQPQSGKPGGLGGFLTSLLPTAGGTGGALAGAAGGAALGSVVPGVGTAIGGLLGAIAGGAGGSALGKVGENAIEGEQDLGRGVGEEALLGGITSTPITGGFKLLKGAVKSPFVEGALKKGAQEAGATAIPKMATGLREKAGAELADATENAFKPGILGRVQQSAARNDAKVSGLGTGKSLNGKTITPKRSQELYDYARMNGVDAGTPQQQAEMAQRLHDANTQALQTSLESINRPLVENEGLSVATSIKSGLKSAKGTGARSNTDTNKFITDLTKAKDIKDLERIRKEADDLAFTAKGAGKTVAAKQAQVVRDSIDKFVTGLSDEYKSVKGSYRNSKDLLELTSKNAGSERGGLNVFGAKVGTQAIPGAISKTSSILSGKKGGLLDRVSKDAASKAPAMASGQGIIGAATRESVLGSRPDLMNPQTSEDATATDQNAPQEVIDVFGDNATLSGQGDGQDVQAQLQAAALQALQSGDTKGLDNIIKVAGLLQSSSPSKGKPMSAEAAKVTSNAQSGLDSLSELEQSLASDPGIQGRSAISSAFNPLGITGNVLGTGGYEANRQNIIDVIARLRTGAAITNDEAKRFGALIPQPADSAQVSAQKIAMLRNQFSDVLNRTGTAGNDTQALLGQ